ncbi:MAG: glycosyltransferase [Bacteroidales bacterium]|nr:glycosyltransferase [Bacteroidales bacterium]
MKFFSIITVCKDNLEELKTTYNSIIEQTIDDYEWVVIDANSSDGTREWLEYINVVNWLSEPDDGIFDGMNKGLSKSTGKYIIFMNSGDCFATHDVLEKSKSTIQNNNLPAFVYGDSIDIDENRSEFYRKAKNHKKLWMGMITQHQAMIFKKEKVAKIKYLDEYPLTGDYAFISEIVKKCNTNEILSLNFAVCKFDMGGTNEKYRFRAIKEDYEIRRAILKLNIFTSSMLYIMHYIHTILKKINPSVRFIRHKATN